MYSYTIYSNKTFWDYTFNPWDSKENYIDSAGYWISFLAIGILTAFIPHLLYHLFVGCEPPPATFDVESPPEREVFEEEGRSEEPPIAAGSARDIVLGGDTEVHGDLDQPTQILGRPRQAIFYDPKDDAIPLTDTDLQDLSSGGENVSDDFGQDDKGSTKTKSPILSRLKPIKYSTVSALEYLRTQQPFQNQPVSKISTLAQLCMRVLMSQAQSNPAPPTLFSLSEVFTGQTYQLFRDDAELQEQQLVNAINAWPAIQPNDVEVQPQPGIQEIYLRGANHLVLSEAFLIHTDFINLDLTGCRFVEEEKFVKALSKQKNLETLFLGLEQFFSASSLQTIAAGCKNLHSLSIAVKTLIDLDPGLNHSQLTHLTIRVSNFTKTELGILFTLFPNLKTLTLWIEFSRDLNCIPLLHEFKPKELRIFNLIHDSSFYSFSLNARSKQETFIEHISPLFPVACEDFSPLNSPLFTPPSSICSPSLARLNSNREEPLTFEEALKTYSCFRHLHLTQDFLEEEHQTILVLEKLKELTNLYLSLEKPITPANLNAIVLNCQELNELTLSFSLDQVEALDPKMVAPNLQKLTLRTNHLTKEALIQLLQIFPNLRKLTLWTDTADPIDFGAVLRSSKLKQFEELNVLNTAEFSQSTHYTTYRQAVHYTTRVDTQSLFGYDIPSKTNFQTYSTIFLLSRYAHDPKKIHTFLKQAAQAASLSTEDLIAIGRCLAHELKLNDIKAFAKVFEPFPMTAGEEIAAYNAPLELILRGAVEYCQENTEAFDDVFDEKKRAFQQLLEDHKHDL